MYFRELRNIQKAWKTRNIRKAWNIQETRKNRKNRKARKTLQYTHGESNPNQRNRNPSFYPLNYERMFLNAAAKIHIIFYITKSFAYFS